MMDNKIKNMVLTAVMTAVICVLGPMSLPIGPVPISLTNLAIYVTMYVLGTKRGTIAYVLYMLIGLVGVPVFSGFTGGPGKLFGPTGGYIIGFLPMAFVIGLFLEKYWRNKIACVAFLEAATWIPYLLGTAWLAYSANMTFQAALAAGVLPFLVLDLIKMVISVIVGSVLKTRLARYIIPATQ